MAKSFRRVILFGKRHRDLEVIATLRHLKGQLERWGVTVSIEAETAALLPRRMTFRTVAEKDFCKQGDLIIVVGGDGSLLNAARVAANQKLPVLGINRGRLGFLTDIGRESLGQIRDILQGKYQEERRFLLQADVYNKQRKIITSQTGLNDIVLLPGEIAHMIEFSIHIDGEFVCVQRADGLIIATPTGSTAYALSGGGPILHPHLAAMVLVPMFPHKLTSRPVVINADSTIEINLDANTDTIPRLSADGQTAVPISAGQRIRIKRYSKPLRLIHPLHYHYFDTLRDKLQWENKPGTS